MSKNLFAFGDSFTSYLWPMWPELMSQDFDKTYNAGYPGCGNYYIFYKVMSEIAAGNITRDDTVMIQWSEPLRQDYIVDKRWCGLGIQSATELIKKDLGYTIEKETVQLKQLTYMLAVAKALETTGCRWYFFFLSNQSMVHRLETYKDLNLESNDFENYEKLVKGLARYKNKIIDEIGFTDFLHYKKMPKIFAAVNSSEKFEDPHPTPLYTLKFILEIISKKMKFDNSAEMLRLATTAEKMIPRPEYYQTTLSEEFDDFAFKNNLRSVVHI